MHRPASEDARVTIGYFSLHTWLGGGEYSLYYLMKSIDQNRFRPLLIVNERGPLTEIVEKSGIEIALVPFIVATPVEMLKPRNIVGNMRASLRIARVVEERRIEIIHCTDILTLFLLFRTLVKRRLPVIYNLFVFYSIPRSWLLNILTFLCVDWIVTNSMAVKKDFLRKTVGAGSRTTVIHCGVDSTRFYPRGDKERMGVRQSLGLPCDKKVIGFIGRYEVWKGHLTFIEAAYRLLSLHDDLYFIMVGGPITSRIAPQVSRYKEKVTKTIQRLGLNGKLITWDHRDDIPAIMAALDVFVCPSDSEPFGLVALEAWESGAPVVASGTVGAVEVLRETPGVFVAEAGNSASFVGEIEKALKLPPAEIAMKRTYGKHGWQTYARQFEAVYEKAAA